MHTELFLLSGQIALLVLLASALAAAIAWMIRGAASKGLAEAQAQRLAAEQQATEAKTALATTEQHCVTALEQRDEAERQAAHHAAENRRLQESLRNIERDAMIQRGELEKTLNAARADATQLSEAKVREATNEAEKAKAELREFKESSIARAEHEKALADLSAKHSAATAELATIKASLEKLQTEAKTTAAQHEKAVSELTEQWLNEAAESEKAKATLDKLQQASVSKADHEALIAGHADRIAALTSQSDDTIGALEQARTELAKVREESVSRAEHEALVAAHAVNIASLTSQSDDATKALEQAQAQLAQLKQDSVLKAEHEAALVEAVAPLQARLVSLGAELEQTKRALQQAKTHAPSLEAPPRPAPAPIPRPIVVAPPKVEEVDDLSFPPAPTISPIKRSLFRNVSATPQPPETESLIAALEHLETMKRSVLEKGALVESLSNELRLPLELDEATLKAVTKKLTIATEDHLRAQRHVEAVQRALAQAEAPEACADDLTHIKGVKEVLNKQLHLHGIFSYRQIVNWTPEDIVTFGEMLSSKQRITKDQWQDQARQLHEARYGERLS